MLETQPILLKNEVALMWPYATSAIKTPKLDLSININKSINFINNLIGKNL